MKQTTKKLLSFVLAVVLCMTSIPTSYSTVYAKDTENIQVYSTVLWPEYATEDYYTITVDSIGRKATLEYTFVTKPDEWKSMNLTLLAKVTVKRQYDNFVNTNTQGIQVLHEYYNSEDRTVTKVLDFSKTAIKNYESTATPNGTEGTIDKYELLIRNTTNMSIMDGDFYIKGGKLSFEPYHSHEEDVLSHLTKQYKPTDFAKFTTNDYNAYNKNGFLNTLQTKVKEITAGCNSDFEKYIAIHDWICSNISYDYPAYNMILGMSNPPNKQELFHIASNPEKVYTYQRAVCDGYSNLARLMFLSAGIPCMKIIGLSASGHSDIGIDQLYYILPDTMLTERADSHAWNAIYLNGSWMFADFTWDAGGKYYGDNSAQNVAPYMAGYKWSNCTAYTFGNGHISFFGPNGRFPFTTKELYPNQNNLENVLSKNPAISKITPANGTISLSWKKISGAKGYEIQCSRNKKFTSIDKITQTSASKTSVKLSKLKKKTTYYLRVRSYTTSYGTPVYGPWSSVKKIKTK